ncbi:MAG: allophanate hydrolase, partial [Thalassolituus oleivorans]
MSATKSVEQKTAGLGWNIKQWAAAYRQGSEPVELLPLLREQIAALEADAGSSVWIQLGTEQQLLAQIENLQAKRANGDSLPLYGVPFAVKDNIDVAGFSTTAACPEFAYQPTEDATAVHLLKQAGAIVIGKTNLDQFATGLVGTRSPYGAVKNSFNSDYISGGS